MANDFNISNNYSYLFSNMNSGTGNSSNFSGINLSDYASLKNGSYYKLTKAYYTKNPEAGKRPGSVLKNADNVKTLSAIQSDASNLSKSASKLVESGDKDLFSKVDITVKNEDGTTTTTKDYDKNKIATGIESFIDNINSLIKSAGESDTKGILQTTGNLIQLTKAYKNLFSKVGITIGSDNQLSVDKDMIKKADISTLKSLFSGKNSYVNNVQMYASKIAYNAANEVKKANTYGSNGSFNRTNSSGSIYDSYL